MILIGSRALKVLAPQLVTRELQDYDLIGTYDEMQSFLSTERQRFKEIYPVQEGKKIIAKGHNLIMEFEIAWPGSTAEEYIKMNRGFGGHHIFLHNVTIPFLGDLLAFKLSHRYLKNSPHFIKTRNDILTMQNAGIEVPSDLKEWLKRRSKETYNYSHPVLEQNKDGFFNKNEGVVYTYDHDSVHMAVKHFDKPAYEYFKRPGSEVMCDRALFESSDKAVQLAAVLEEAQVLALERSQIPFPGKWSPKKSFTFALQKVCTSITSGWFREFAYENYDSVIDMYENNYVDNFWKAVESGIVKKL